MQALNIIFLGDQSGKGTFFPEGILGKINTPKGFDELASGTENFPIWPKKAPQVFTSFYLADQFSAVWFVFRAFSVANLHQALWAHL